MARSITDSNPHAGGSAGGSGAQIEEVGQEGKEALENHPHHQAHNLYLGRQLLMAQKFGMG